MCVCVFWFDKVRIDMSEYMEKHSVSRLIGAPPGYVGFDKVFAQYLHHMRTYIHPYVRTYITYMHTYIHYIHTYIHYIHYIHYILA